MELGGVSRTAGRRDIKGRRLWETVSASRQHYNIFLVFVK
jgi:hypothetical protein